MYLQHKSKHSFLHRTPLTTYLPTDSVALRLASRTVNSNALSILSLDDVALDYDGAIKTYTGSGTDLVIGMEGAALYASSPNALEVLLGEALAKTWANRYNKNTDIVL